MTNSDREESHSEFNSPTLQRSFQYSSESRSDNQNRDESDSNTTIGQFDGLTIDQLPFQQRTALFGGNEENGQLSDEKKDKSKAGQSTHQVVRSRSTQDSWESDLSSRLKSMNETFSGNKTAEMSSWGLGHVAAMHKDPFQSKSSNHESKQRQYSNEIETEEFAGNTSKNVLESESGAENGDEVLKDMLAQIESRQTESKMEEAKHHEDNNSSKGQEQTASESVEQDTREEAESVAQENDQHEGVVGKTEDGFTNELVERSDSQADLDAQANAQPPVAEEETNLQDDSTKEMSRQIDTSQSDLHREDSTHEASQPVLTDNTKREEEALEENRLLLQEIPKISAEETASAGGKEPVEEQAPAEQRAPAEAATPETAQPEVSEPVQSKPETLDTKAPRSEEGIEEASNKEESVKAVENNASVVDSTREESSLETSAQERSTEETPAEEVLAEEVSSQEVSAQETPTNETVISESSTQETAPQVVSTPERPPQDASMGEGPSNEPLTQSTLTEENGANEAKTQEQSTQQDPALNVLEVTPVNVESTSEQFRTEAQSSDQHSNQNETAEATSRTVHDSNEVNSGDKSSEDASQRMSADSSLVEPELGTKSPTSRFYRTTSSALNRTGSMRKKNAYGRSSYQGSMHDDGASDTYSHWRDQSNFVDESSVGAAQAQSSSAFQTLRLTSDTIQDESSNHTITQDRFDDERSIDKDTSPDKNTSFESASKTQEQLADISENRDDSSRRSIRSSVKGSVHEESREQSQPNLVKRPSQTQANHLRDESPDASERTPLLVNRGDDTHDISYESESEPKKKSRLPSFVALGFLCVLIILAIVFGFAAPAAVQEYAKEAVTFKATNLSIDSLTDIGVRTRAQGVFWLDGSKVQKKSVRDLGRAATWIASKVESGDAEIKIYIPENSNKRVRTADYKDALVGTVRIPPVLLDIRDGHKNQIDIVSELEPGNVNVLQSIAKDYLDGKRWFDIKAVANVPVRSGILNLGKQHVTQWMRINSTNTPKIPGFDISGLQVAEYGYPGHPEGLKALAAVTAMNPYPIKFDVPPLSFEVLLPDCANDYLMLGKMSTDWIHILPQQNVTANVTGIVNQLPKELTQPCPGSTKSPLDSFVGKYLGGNDTTIYVRGGEQGVHTPVWIGQLLRAAVLPVPVPSHPFDNAIKNFSLTNVYFQLPETSEGNPKLSATVEVVVGLPKGINIDVDVGRVRADADVFFKGRALGKLDLRKWQESNSTRYGNELHVRSEVIDAPLQITDQDVFTEVLQEMIFGKRGVHLGVQANVDVDTTTAIGQFVVRKIPGKGEIFIKPVGGKFEHTVKGISVVGSTPDELILEARVSVKNPTEYSAHVPYVNISVWCNDTRLGYAWGSFDVGPGENELAVQASWYTGPVGAEFLSQYISGHNTSFELRSHRGSVPGLPDPKLAVNVTVPHLFGKFLKETTMHIWSSTAEFILFSPIPMYVTSIWADAYYNGTEIGIIQYDEPFKVAAGDSPTPRLPVAWNTDGGLGLIRDALGGQLKLDAHADVGVRIGQWQETIWYEAKGLGAKVRL